ncbi:MAG: hypothetical protein AAFX06_22905 [Planctomycetota bacterium]
MNSRIGSILFAALFLVGCSREPDTPAPQAPNALITPEQAEETAASSEDGDEQAADMEPESNNATVTLPAGSGAKLPDARGGLSGAGILYAKINQGIGLLEGEQYRAFLELFRTPKEVERLKNKGQFEAVLEEFSVEKAPALLAALKSIQGKSPELSDDKTTASFPLSEELDGKDKLALVDLAGDWYIPNESPED